MIWWSSLNEMAMNMNFDAPEPFCTAFELGGDVRVTIVPAFRWRDPAPP